MSNTRRLRTLGAQEKRLNDQIEEIKGQMITEIVEIMVGSQIDVKNVHEKFRERINREFPQNRRYSKRPIRFRDPETGDTWAGVGVRPRWLRERLEEGRTLEEFKVDPSTCE